VTKLRRWLRAALFAACAGLLAFTLLRIGERGRFARALSSYGSGSEGTRALYLLVQELGFETLRWSQDLARLPAQATLIALGSCENANARALSRYESAELLGWIERGGVLIVAGARNYLPEELGVSFQDDAECENESQHSAVDDDSDHADSDETVDGGTALAADDPALQAPEQPIATAEDGSVWGVPMSASFEGLPIVQFRKPGVLTVDADLDVEVLLGVPSLPDANTADMRPLAVAVQRGQGRVIVLSAANMLQNAELDNSEGATFFLRLLRGYGNSGLLIFDEYHLGLGERRSLMQYMRELGAMPLLFQMLVIAFVALRRLGARVGEARPTPNLPAPAGTASYVAALGGLYAKVKDKSGALRLIARSALSRIGQYYGLGNLQPDVLERALSQRGATQAASAVREIVAAISGKIEPKTETPSLVATVERIDRALGAAIAPK
jgi:hypothetical protein